MGVEQKSNYHQGRANELQHQIHNGDSNLAGRLGKYEEETSEALRLVAGMTVAEINLLASSPYFSDRLGREVVDSIIAGLGVLTELGKNFNEMFDEQVDQAMVKYAPHKIQSYIDRGYSREEAVALVKRDWTIDTM